MKNMPLFPKLILMTLGGGLAIAYLCACIFVLFRQNRFIFYPSPTIKITPATLNLEYQDVWLPVSTADKSDRIHGWWIPASQAEAGAVLYLHGNGGNIGSNVAHAKRFHQLGFSVLLIDYRGYGRSKGSFPTESSVYEDAQTAWNYLIEARRIPPKQIFLYGHSLGGAIAIDLAVHHPETAGLIVEGSFTSMRKMADYKGSFWMFPVDLLLTQRFDSINKVKLLKMPVLFIHGQSDTVIPYQMSKILFAAAPEPKQLLLIPGAEHNNAADVANFQYIQTVQIFFGKINTHFTKNTL